MVKLWNALGHASSSPGLVWRFDLPLLCQKGSVIFLHLGMPQSIQTLEMPPSVSFLTGLGPAPRG